MQHQIILSTLFALACLTVTAIGTPVAAVAARCAIVCEIPLPPCPTSQPISPCGCCGTYQYIAPKWPTYKHWPWPYHLSLKAYHSNAVVDFRKPLLLIPSINFGGVFIRQKCLARICLRILYTHYVSNPLHPSLHAYRIAIALSSVRVSGASGMVVIIYLQLHSDSLCRASVPW
jgi:hypothetical protein